jgi:phosphatidylglycerol:prolipoprotein diacylglycerol transferase
MATAILAGILLAIRLSAHSKDITTEDVVSAATWTAIGGIIGARLLFVVLKWSDYSHNLTEIIDIQQGGLSIHGAVLGGAIALFLYTVIEKKSFLLLADLFALVLPLGQLIGRFGNFFNQEAFGGPTTLPWKMFVNLSNRPDGYEIFKYFHPTFLYEGIGNLLILILLLRVYQKSHLPGQIVSIYLIMYSGLRFVTEIFRVDSDRWFTISLAQWASLAIIIIVSIIWIRNFRRK